MDYTIVAIKVENRDGVAPSVQEILTKYGCNIRIRLGLHDHPGSCAPSGLILLEMSTGPDEITDMLEELDALNGVTAKFVEI